VECHLTDEDLRDWRLGSYRWPNCRPITTTILDFEKPQKMENRRQEPLQGPFSSLLSSFLDHSSRVTTVEAYFKEYYLYLLKDTPYGTHCFGASRADEFGKWQIWLPF
jgi:hypothetical protein